MGIDGDGKAFYLETKFKGTEHHRPEQINFIEAMQKSRSFSWIC